MSIIKTRKIKLVHPDKNCVEKAVRVLKESKGVNKLNYAQDKEILSINYNLEKIMFKAIEETLHAQGIQLNSTFFQRMQRNLIHFTEQNELDNLHIQPTCCSDPKLPQ